MGADLDVRDDGDQKSLDERLAEEIVVTFKVYLATCRWDEKKARYIAPPDGRRRMPLVACGVPAFIAITMIIFSFIHLYKITHQASTVPLTEASADTAIDDRLRGVCEWILKGKVDEGSFTELAKEIIVPSIRREIEENRGFSSMGALKSFRRVNQREDSGYRTFEYKAEMERGPAKLTFVLDNMDKICNITYLIAIPAG